MGPRGRHLLTEPAAPLGRNDLAGRVAQQVLQIADHRRRSAVQYPAQRPQGMIGRTKLVQVNVRGREMSQPTEGPSRDDPGRRRRHPRRKPRPRPAGRPGKAACYRPRISVPPSAGRLVARPARMPPSAARCSMARAVHGVLAGPRSTTSPPVQRIPSTIAAKIAPVASRPSLATAIFTPLCDPTAVIRRANSTAILFETSGPMSLIAASLTPSA